MGAGVPHWDELSDNQRVAAERLMEVYAAFAEHTDAQVGRLVEHLRATGQLDNTVVLYILGDNGASAEGGLEGTLNETIRLNGLPDSADRIVTKLDTIGGPEAWAHYPVGWALAMDTPYQWSKQVASHYGGTRNGLVVHWPDGIEARGEIRHQWHHVIDVVPTLLELIGVPQPDTVNGVPQDPIEGVSFAYSLNDAAGRRAAHHAVLRDVRQPRRLPPRLDRGHQAPHPVGHRRPGDAGLRRRRVGALRHPHRLVAEQGPRRQPPREAGRAAGALPRGGAQAPGAAARRPDGGAAQLVAAGPARAAVPVRRCGSARAPVACGRRWCRA